MAPLPRPSRRRARGFTLIEVLMALLVVGMLAAVAMPAFFDTLRKSRRADAVAALAQVQQAQERWRASRSSYTASLADLGLGALASGTPSGHYTVAIDAAGDSAYTVTASAAGAQARDTTCRCLRVVMAGGNLSYLAAPAGCTTFAASPRCWAS